MAFHEISPLKIKIDDFQYDLLLFNQNHDYNGVKKLLKIENNDNSRLQKYLQDNNLSYNGCGENNGNEVEVTYYATIKSDENTKRILDVVRYVIAGKVFKTWSETMMLSWVKKLEKLGIDEIDSLMVSYSFSRGLQNKSVIGLTLNEGLWKLFKTRCFMSNVTISDNFKYALFDYIVNVD